MIKDPEDSKEKPFLSRWSKRKQEVEQETAPQPQEVESTEPQIPLNTVIAAESSGRMTTRVEADRLAEERNADVPVLSDEDMPPIESLNEESDFTGFMSPGVSEKLRKLALRKLFAGAGFNIRDGLDDYDDDFTNFPPLGDIVTCDMKHQMEMKEKKKKEAEEEEERLAQEQAAEIEKTAETDQLDSAAKQKDDTDNKDKLEQENQLAMNEDAELSEDAPAESDSEITENQEPKTHS